MQITGDIGKIWKTVQRHFKFIFDELSEYDNSLVPNLIVLAKKKVVSFT